MKVMIVEDEKVIRLSLRKVIESETAGAFRIAGEAKDGQAALAMLEQLRPDIVITDIRMPVMDGLTFIEEMQKNERQAEVVILSGYDEFDYAKRAMRFGVSDYLLKPIDADELIQTLQRIQSRLRKADRFVSEHIEWLRYEKRRARTIIEAMLQFDRDKVASEVDAFYRQSLPKLQEHMRVKEICESFAELLEEERQQRKEWNGRDGGSRTTFGEDGEQNVRLLKNELFALIDDLASRRNWAASLIAKRAIDYMEKHYSRFDLKLQDVADELGISAFYLSRTFKEETGTNFIVYLTAYRLKQAIRLMGDPAAKLYTISLQVGYEEYAHFSRVFKKVHGVSPVEYRKLAELV
ncbi:response regulator [Paenibacillus hodogayensis]|uniref:Response regulator n=1 Tax=Paenibacillus hodogayensis TaxID=279208 RepID=A0ABV5VTK9_9BACL